MWLIYALGGGWGHLTRAASLARAARQRVMILSNSPHAPAIRDRVPEAEVRVLDAGVTAAAARDAVVAELAEGPSCLIVDTFPRGLGGELADLLDAVTVPKVLVHRDLNPRYALRHRGFVSTRYDLVIVPGKGEGGAFGDLPNAVTTAPWLIRSRAEITPAEPRGVFVCAAGRAEEAEWYRAVDGRLREEGIAVECADGSWPAMDRMASAAVAVGGGGYNTVHECAALGIPLVARPWTRKYDRQALRIERASQWTWVRAVESVEQAVAAVRDAPVPAGGLRTFANGAAAAAERIGRLTEQHGREHAAPM